MTGEQENGGKGDTLIFLLTHCPMTGEQENGGKGDIFGPSAISGQWDIDLIFLEIFFDFILQYLEMVSLTMLTSVLLPENLRAHVQLSV